MKKIVLASGNKGKLREFAQLFANMEPAIEVVPQSDFDVPEAEETGLTFVENAIIKARNAAKHTGLPAIADDSGIEVDALMGKPGIYSARFAGADASDDDNLNFLLSSLQDKAERTARYQCLLVYMQHENDPTPLISQASWEGRILTKPIGDGGFGYDPIFWVEETQCSAAELTAEQKHAISHRGKAIRIFIDQFQTKTSL